MREPIRDRERLEHIKAAIDRIIRYTSDKSYEDLVADDMMYYAVVKNIEIIGEAANMLTQQFQQLHTETPWKMVKGMRNYIVHEYRRNEHFKDSHHKIPQVYPAMLPEHPVQP